MKKVYFATRARGFFKHLFANSGIDYTFVTQEAQIYEVNGWKRNLISRIAKMKIFDLLGTIQVIKCSGRDCDIYGSSNRFLECDKPYFIYLENPTALYHYRLARGKSALGRRKLEKQLSDPNLRAVICMSNACFSTFEKLCGEFRGEKKLIYPYIPANRKADEEAIRLRCRRDELNLLFITQGDAFISKGVLDILEAFGEVRGRGNENVYLTIVTTVNEVDSSIVHRINETEGITLLDFNLDYGQMEELYAGSSVLLHPTSHDSFALVVLEAIKAGLPVIGTRLYAIPEMVTDRKNGFLTDPKYWFFDKDNMPNPEVWEHREETIYSRETSRALVDFLRDRICLLDADRELLERMSLESLRVASSPPFDEKTITAQWNEALAGVDREVQQ